MSHAEHRRAPAIDPRVLAPAHAHMVDVARTLARLSPRGASRELDGLVLVSTGFPTSQLNYGFATRLPAQPQAALRESRQFFAEWGVDWRLWAWGQTATALAPLAAAEGFRARAPEPGLLLRPLPATAPPVPPDLAVEPVTDPEGLRLFQTTFARAFDLPLAEVELVFNAGLLTIADAAILLGRANGEPAAMALGFTSHRIAGIFAVGTLPAYRRRGLGTALTWHAATRNRGGCLGAYLTASPIGLPVYRAMGFEPVVAYQRWAG